VREVGEQAVEDRQRLVPVVDADVHVDAPDHHVAAPPPGALDELVVPRLVGEALVVPLAEGVRAAADELVVAELVDHRPDLRELPLQVGDGVGDPVVHAAHELDGVGEQLRRDGGMRPAGTPLVEQLEHAVADRGELAGGAIHDRDLPLEADAGPGRTGEVDLHGANPLHGVGCADVGSSWHATRTIILTTRNLQEWSVEFCTARPSIRRTEPH